MCPPLSEPVQGIGSASFTSMLLHMADFTLGSHLAYLENRFGIIPVLRAAFALRPLKRGQDGLNTGAVRNPKTVWSNWRMRRFESEVFP